MTPEDSAQNSLRFARVQELFRDALALPQNCRPDFLSSACGDDRSLFVEVHGMLEEDARGSSLLDDGIALAAHQVLEEINNCPVRKIGPYSLVRLLGEGGMGVVYLAERADLGNPVAIKLLRDAWLSPLRRERFLSEQRLLALLVHPAIARLYDAGVMPDGTPWFAMEYVEGTALGQYCQHHRCTLQERLRLFRSICEAVQHAHEHAVIHRDLKPSNILVKSDGTVRLLDFGIAKQIIHSEIPAGRTQTVLRLMTPAYSAPEQVIGSPIGVFTDVYALGIILYELLAGHVPTPFSTEPRRFSDRPKMEGDRERPSVAAKRSSVCTIPKAEWADLDVLCLTSIQVDAARRYRSVEALIRDVDHYIARQPLEARPDSFGYRLDKFLRRNRRPVIATILIIVSFVALAGFFTIRLANARDVAITAAVREQRIQRFMLQLFDGGEKAAGPAADLRVVTVIDRGVQEARALDGDPATQADLYGTLGAMYQKLGSFDKADSVLTRALEERKRSLGPNRSDVAEGFVNLGLLRIDQARFPEAESLIRKGIELAKHGRPVNENVVAKATAALGKVREASGDYKHAIPLLEQAIALHSKKDLAPNELAGETKELADTYFYAGQYDTSIRLTQRAMALHTRLHGYRHPLVADDLINLGAVQIEKGNYVEAERLYRKALSINQAWYGKDHPETAADLYMLGEALVYQRRLHEAEPILRDALALRERVYGPVHPRSANVLNEICTVESLSGRSDEAEACYRRVVEIYKTTYHDKHYLIALAIANLATVQMKRGEYGRAESGFRDALKRYGSTLASDHLYVGIAQFKLGHSLMAEKRNTEAEQALVTACKILEKQGNSSLSWLQKARSDLASLHGAAK